jgi:hypothetical protein
LDQLGVGKAAFYERLKESLTEEPVVEEEVTE